MRLRGACRVGIKLAFGFLSEIGSLWNFDHQIQPQGSALQETILGRLRRDRGCYIGFFHLHICLLEHLHENRHGRVYEHLVSRV